MTTLTPKDKENIIKKYEKSIAYAASKLTSDTDLQDDLKQEGSIGLYLALDKWDETKSNNKTQHQFYVMHIRYTMLDYLTKYSRVVKIPKHLFRGNEELRRAHISVSLDHFIDSDETNEDNQSTFAEQLIMDNEEHKYDEEKLRVIKNQINQLSPYQQELFDLYFFQDLSKTEISKTEISGKTVTRQSIGQHINGCIDKIKQNISKTNNIKLS